MILGIEDVKATLARLKDELAEIRGGLNVEGMERELAELKEEMGAPGFWDNLERSAHVNRRISALEEKIGHFDALVRERDDLEVLIELSEEENDRAAAQDAQAEIGKLTEKVEALSLETLMRGPYDGNDAILSLHAGAGGTEAQDWTQMLYRMYTRYCEKMGFKVTLLDYLEGDEAGIKSVSFEVSGENAYGYLRGEKGVHRLVRISPFDSNARRHTSFTSLDVAPVLEDDGEIEIDMQEVRVDTYRSTGAGGQHVNKTDSAVRMTHMPSGIVVSCQNERSQVQNREMCMKMLRARLLELRERENEEKMAEIKGEMKKIEWGSQIRSYVFQPYTMVKDHRTGFETGGVDAVMNGELDGFVTAYLKMQ
ncbi:MAG TPA: peptide chain release factor 2 [Candidatus Limnocylindria bacterium]|nr:peptide chain release factor 2 [Candidatus Limnocylindria bacterium]